MDKKHYLLGLRKYLRDEMNIFFHYSKKSNCIYVSSPSFNMDVLLFHISSYPFTPLKSVFVFLDNDICSISFKDE